MDENKRYFKQVEVKIDNFETALVSFKYKGEVVKQVLVSLQHVDIVPNKPKTTFSNIRIEIADTESNASSQFMIRD